MLSLKIKIYTTHKILKLAFSHTAVDEETEVIPSMIKNEGLKDWQLSGRRMELYFHTTFVCE